MRLFVTSLIVCFSASAHAELLCSVGEASDANLKLRVDITNATADRLEPLVMVTAPNPDKSYTLMISYRPTEAGLGQPSMFYVKALVPYPTQGEPEPLRIEWRSGSGPWVNPGFWSTPQRWFPKEEMRGATDYKIAQGKPFPSRTDLLDEIGRGARFEFRNLDQNGDVVNSGWAEYPEPQRIAQMYHIARAGAVARLSPCGPPAAVIRPYVPPAPTN